MSVLISILKKSTSTMLAIRQNGNKLQSFIIANTYYKIDIG